MHEIITLQLGQRSNYLATHFWNIQESYFTYSEQEASLVNHDVHFRAGIGADGSETFTPRTLIYDLKGGFGSLRKINALYDTNNESEPVRPLWDGSTSTQQQDHIGQTAYQRNLDLGLPTSQLHENDIRYWSDFNRVYYHPRSIVQLNEYELNSQIMPFENWAAGEDLFQNLDKEFDLIDRDLRPFAEECDQIQGLQILTGTDDAWGGFASKYLENIRDEYGKTSIWVWGVEDGSRVSRAKQHARTANSARSLRMLGQQASAYVRMAAAPPQIPGYVNIKSTSNWITTSLLCAAWESSTLPTRLIGNGTRKGTLSLFEDILNTNSNQQLLELKFSVKEAQNTTIQEHTPGGTERESDADQRHNSQSTEEGEMLSASDFDMTLSPEYGDSTATRPSHIFAQVESSRHSIDYSRTTSSIDEEERLRRKLNDETIIERFDTALPFPLLDTFPDKLFRITQQPESRRLEMTAGLTSSSRMKDQVMAIRNSALRLIELDEREAFYNDLTEMANAYGYGWESDEDSGEDAD